MGRLILLFVGANLVAVLQMAWGFAFWTATPIPFDYMVQPMPAEHEGLVIKDLEAAKLESGHYFYPWAGKDVMLGKESEAQKTFFKKHEEGPLVEIVYHKGGLSTTQEMLTYVYGYLHFLGCSLLAGLMLMLASRGLPSYFSRLLFLLMLAVFAPVAITLANPIWYHHPCIFSLVSAGFEMVAWLIAAIVLAAFVRPPRIAVATAPVRDKKPPLRPEDFSPTDRVRG